MVTTQGGSYASGLYDGLSSRFGMEDYGPGWYNGLV